MEPLPLEDFLLIAELVLDTPAETVKHAAKLGLAESALNAPFASFAGEDFYPEPADKAAILCSRIVRNHPLPDGNKRVALLCTLDFMERNGMVWTAPTQDELAQTIEWLAAGTLAESDFTTWVRAHVRRPGIGPRRPSR
jgi:death-on-curing protein